MDAEPQSSVQRQGSIPSMYFPTSGRRAPSGRDNVKNSYGARGLQMRQRTGSAMSYLICLQRSPRSPTCCCSFGEIRTVFITRVNSVGEGYSGNSSGRACAARIHEEHGSSVALVRVFLTPRKGPVRRASRWEDRRRASAGGPRTFRPGRAGTATRSVRPVRVRGTPVFTHTRA